MFEITQDQALLRDAVDGYLRDRAAAGERMFLPERWRRLASELDILAAAWPQEAGGLGGGLVDGALIMERLGEHLIAQPFLQSAIMAGRAVAQAGGPHAEARLDAIRTGETIVALAWMENDVLTDPRGIACQARREGDGFVLDGTKTMVRAGPWATHVLVAARSAGERGTPDGLSLFLIGKDHPGVSSRDLRTIDGWACSDIVLSGVRAYRDDMVGRPGEALPLVQAMLVDEKAALCAEAIGLMRSMITQTSAYLQQRQQFGKPLASFQALRHRFVDMQLACEHATSIARAAIVAVSSPSPDSGTVLAAAKYVVDRALDHVGREALQMHGAIGLMAETPIAQYFRRATALRLQCGSAEDQLELLAAHAGSTVGHDHDGSSGDVLARLMGAQAGEDEAFRAEVRAFIAAEFTQDLRADALWDVGAFATPEAGTPWHRKLAAKGWAAPSWPVEHGGPGWTARQRQIFEEEMEHAGTPRLPAMGLQMVAPVIMRYGTEAQKARFLPPLLAGDECWCQGYSEPGAGSDLAALQLRARREGDEYTLNGSKIWTTFAQFADWIFVLARTADSERRQDGISFILVPMTAAGVTVRPLISLSGEHEVNQVFFDDVRVPVDNRVGEENQGWQVAKYLLEFERGVGQQVPALVTALGRLRHVARHQCGAGGRPLWDAPAFRRRFAALEARTLAIRLTEERLVYALPPGASVGDFAASLMKLSWSEMAQGIEELTIEALGPLAAIDQQAAFEAREASLAAGPSHAHGAMRRYLNDRSMTIAGGSSEIQRTILAKLLLG